MNLNAKQLKSLVNVVAITASDIEIEKIEGDSIRVRVEYGLEVIESFVINKEGEVTSRS